MHDPDNIEELRGMGAYIQVNADAVLGIDGRGAKNIQDFSLNVVL